MNFQDQPPLIAIACGGTGGHLFPGLAVAEVLRQWDCAIALLVSKKEVDQEAIKFAADMRVVTLPAVGLQNWRWAAFVRGCWHSYRLCRRAFLDLRPRAVLAMGGFTSAPPVLAGKSHRAATFLHESNSIPGRANRWLSPWVDEVFISFPTAARRLYNQCIRSVGTPVRPAFKPVDPVPCRIALGLAPEKPVLLVMGGSQGASGINRLMEGAIAQLGQTAPELQFLHLTGPDDCEKVRSSYASHGRRAVVRPFLSEMELALGAATVVVNRAGASSLAEVAAMRVPCILIPFPYATDNHQLFNARAAAESGAARLLEQFKTTPALLAETIQSLLYDLAAQARMRAALERWHFPKAAEEIAGHICARLGLPRPESSPAPEDAPAMPAVLKGKWAGGQVRFTPATLETA
ncbi:MAG: UDP-N-acetylglucosamine--N-acetylmuramyl-(pentapeptide) pyrophosphoryl-undecaprenol N-acetylglucosamine transferase [Verrucomicrobiota bacterium]